MVIKKILFLLIGTLITVMMSHLSYAADKQNGYYRKQHNREYREALKILWTKVYPQKGRTLYCEQLFSTRNYKERKQHVNAEHVFPMSWVTKDLQCGQRKKCQKSNARFRQIESDLHNIYPARIKVNQARSNYRFGEVAGELRQFGSCDFEVNRKKRIAEPKTSSRGKIARSMRYMHYQYGLTLHKKTEKLMQQWDKKYPPTQEEVRRAMIIQHEQGRENPFVTRYPFQGQGRQVLKIPRHCEEERRSLSSQIRKYSLGNLQLLCKTPIGLLRFFQSGGRLPRHSYLVPRNDART